ncbi:MAG TPA: DUF4476 domain-containing protein, partial [Chitinophagaceae bacterium]
TKDVVAQPAINKEEKNTNASTKDIVQAVNTDQPKAETKPIESDSSNATTSAASNNQKASKEIKEEVIAKDEKVELTKQDQKAIEDTVTVTQNKTEQKPFAEIITKQDEIQPPVKQEEATSTEPVSEYKKSQVTRRAESSTTEGFGLVFLDNMDGVTDTIRLLIPNPKIQLINNTSQPTKEETVKTEEEKTVVKEEPAKDVKALENNDENKTEETAVTPDVPSKKEEANDKTEKPLFGFRKKDKTTSDQSALKEKEDESKKEKPLISFKKKDNDQDEAPSVVTESRLADVQPDGSRPSEKVSNNQASCRSMASENDFLKLRKNMASESDEESMIDAARKFFRSKCFSTEQVKNLGALFLTEESKYNFYDLAYKYVHDRDQFRSLGSELKEDYYIRRFKALIGE